LLALCFNRVACVCLLRTTGWTGPWCGPSRWSAGAWSPRPRTPTRGAWRCTASRSASWSARPGGASGAITRRGQKQKDCAKQQLQPGTAQPSTPVSHNCARACAHARERGALFFNFSMRTSLASSLPPQRAEASRRFLAEVKQGRDMRRSSVAFQKLFRGYLGRKAAARWLDIFSRGGALLLCSEAFGGNGWSS